MREGIPTPLVSTVESGSFIIYFYQLSLTFIQYSYTIRTVSNVIQYISSLLSVKYFKDKEK